MNHFDEMTVLLYLEGQLDAERAREVKEHAASCPSCRALLGALESEGIWLRESLGAEDESVPARLVAAPERGAAPWGWLTALGLGAGGAYTLWTGFVEPWQAQAEQAGFTQGNLLTMLFFSGSFWKGWDAMRSAMELVAMATLGLIVMWLLRRRFRRATTFAVVMAAALCAVAAPPPAAAADAERGDPNYTLAAGQVVKTDLFVTADRVVIDGDVDGDLVSWSRSLTVNGHIKGDILAGGELIAVNGAVDGNLRVFCQTLEITGSVDKNLMAWSSSVTLDRRGKVAGTGTIGAEEVDLDGHIDRDLLALFKALNLNGSIGGKLQTQGRSLTIGPGAEIAGAAKFKGANPPHVDPGAKLGGGMEFVRHEHGVDRRSPRYYWHQILLWGTGFVFGLVLLLVAPGFFYDATNACKKVGPTLGLGVLFLIGLPVAAILVCVTIVGIPVGLTALLLYVIALFSTQVFVGTWLGERILGTGAGFGPTLGRLALGLAIIRVLRLIPYLGALVAAVVVVWGLGALVLTLYRYMRPQFAPAAA
jgi:cytoskeletal protein CcmA (bactofilin family)